MAMNVSGAVSGLDTESIINSLVSLQQRQQTQLKTQQTSVQKAADTYGTLITSLGSLADLAKTVARTTDWQSLAATSTASSVSVTASGSAAASFSFTVSAVAASHSLITTDGLTSLEDLASPAGEISFVKPDGSSTALSVGDGSLGEVIDAINSSSLGYKAKAVQVTPGQYRLQVNATATGADTEFDIEGLDGFTATKVVTAGTDATIHVGSPDPLGYDYTSSTNTFNGVVSGLSFTVSKVETSAVTVSSTVDASAPAAAVKKLVDAANSLLSSISTATAWNATTKTGGPLLGDSTVRSLQQSVLQIVSGSSAPGTHLTRNGTLSFDEKAFTDAFKADPAKVMKAYGAGLSFDNTGLTGTLTLAGSTPATRAGNYDVVVTQAAAREQWQLDAPGDDLSDQTLEITRGSTTVSYVVGTGESLASVAKALNSQLSAAGLGIEVSVGDESLLLTAANAGSSQAFSVTWDGNDANQVTAGADVQGTIDGQDATGLGDVLTLTKGTGGAVGLSVRSTLTDDDLGATAGEVGAVGFTPGLAQRLQAMVADATSTGTGLLVSAKAGRAAQVKTYQDQIDSWDRRLTAYRATLLSQFTTMETTIATLKSSLSSLGLNSLPTASSSSSSSSSSG